MNITRRRVDTWQDPVNKDDFYNGKLVIVEATDTGEMTEREIAVALSKYLDERCYRWKMILSQPTEKRLVAELF